MIQKLDEDKILAEITEWAKENVLSNALAIFPDQPVLDLTRSVYNLLMFATDKVMRPKRRSECELVMILEDVVNNLNVELVNAGIDVVEFETEVIEHPDGTIINLRVLCQKKVMTDVSVRTAFLIPMLQKRYKELKLNIRV